MKYLLIILFSAVLLGAAIVASGFSLSAMSVVAIVCASCLPAWVLRDYRRVEGYDDVCQEAHVPHPEPQSKRAAKSPRPAHRTEQPLLPAQLASTSLEQ